MPGGVDVHTHLDMPFMGTFSTDDFYTGTVAAAFGGTTSIIDYVIPEKSQSCTEAINVWHEKAKNKAVIDYGFHLAVIPRLIICYQNSLILKSRNHQHKMLSFIQKCFNG